MFSGSQPPSEPFSAWNRPSAPRMGQFKIPHLFVKKGEKKAVKRCLGEEPGIYRKNWLFILFLVSKHRGCPFDTQIFGWLKVGARPRSCPADGLMGKANLGGHLGNGETRLASFDIHYFDNSSFLPIRKRASRLGVAMPCTISSKCSSPRFSPAATFCNWTAP